MRVLTRAVLAAMLVLLTQLPETEVSAGVADTEPASTTRVAITSPPDADAPTPSPDLTPLAMFDQVPAGSSHIATLRSTTSVHESAGGPVVERLSPRTRLGAPTTLSVLGEADGEWLQVRLDQRPNGSLGWVRTADVDVTWTAAVIVIDLSERRLVLFEDAQPVVSGTVAVGRDGSLTPTGRTYVTEVLATPAATIYGPYALGLAMYSATETEFAGGNGQIAIHGTDRPDLLGAAVSRGCVRTDNDLIRRLAGRVPLGTPVVIVD